MHIRLCYVHCVRKVIKQKHLLIINHVYKMLMFVLVLINKHEVAFSMYLVEVDYACLFVRFCV